MCVCFRRAHFDSPSLFGLAQQPGTQDLTAHQQQRPRKKTMVENWTNVPNVEMKNGVRSGVY